MNIEIRTLRGRSLAEHRDRTDWTRHRIRSLTFADHRANSPAKTNSNCLAERVALIGINSGQGVSKSTYWAGEDDADGRVVVAQSSWAARSDGLLADPPGQGILLAGAGIAALPLTAAAAGGTSGQPSITPHSQGAKTMSTITTKDGTEISPLRRYPHRVGS